MTKSVAETTQAAESLSGPIDGSISLRGDFSALAVIQGDGSANDLGSSSQTAAVTINGGAGADTLRGGSGADQLNGDDGNDLIIGWGGSDTMNGGAGIDTVSYATETGPTGLVVNLATTAWTFGATTIQALTGSDSWGAVDTYVGIERLIGSAHEDLINAAATAQAWYINGDSGNDTLIGGGLDDTLVGGAGNDTLNNGQVLYEGSTAVYIDLGTQTASGQGEDTFIKVTWATGGDGDDTLMGGASRDTLDGGAGDDILNGGFENDRIIANRGSDTVYGAFGNDFIVGNHSTTLTYEGAAADISADLNGGHIRESRYQAGDFFYEDTVSGIHTLIATSFGDYVSGGATGEVLYGMAGNDRISANGGSDTIDGGEGNDSLDGGYGTDSILGGMGDDTLTGGDDADTLVGGTGNDVMIGGSGNDVYDVDSLNDIVTETDGQQNGVDTVYVSVANYLRTKLANVENVILVGQGSVFEDNHTPSAPVLSGGAITEEALTGALVGTLSATDEDGDQVTFTFANALAGTDGLVSADSRFAIVDGTMTVRDQSLIQVTHDTAFTYAVLASDGRGLSSTAQITINVADMSPVNHAPTAIVLSGGAINEAAQTGALVGTLSATDEEGDAVSFIFANALAGSNGLVSADGRFAMTTNGTITVFAASQIQVFQDSTYNYAVVASDGHGGNASSTITIAVANVPPPNRAPAEPALSGGAITEAALTGAVVGTLSATDQDGDGVTFTFASALAGSNGLVSADGRFVIVGGTIKVQDSSLIQVTQNSSYDYAVLASDGHGGTASSTITITVADAPPANRAPAAPALSGGAITDAAQTGAVVGTLSATDQDGDAVSFKFSGALVGSNGLISADGRFVIVGGTIKVQNSSLIQVSEDSSYAYTVVASDGHGGTTSSSITITVANVPPPNHAPAEPALSGGAITEVALTGSVVGTLSATDQDGDAVTFTFANALAGSNGLVSADGRFIIVGGTIKVQDSSLIQVSQDSSYAYTVVTSDGHGGTASSTVTITVANVPPPNHAPAGAALTGGAITETALTGSVVGTLSATDQDGDVVTFTFANALAGSNGLVSADGRFVIVGGTIKVQDSSLIQVAQDSSYAYTVVTSDGHGGTASSSLTIAVANVPPPNHAPAEPALAGGAITEAALTGAVVGTLSATDQDGDAVTFIFSNALAGSDGLISADGRFVIVGGTIKVQDSSLIQVTQNSSYDYAVLASDGHGGTALSSITITVADVPPANRAPAAPALSGGAITEAAQTGAVVGALSATDQDGDAVTFIFANALAGSDGLISADGRLVIVGGTIKVQDSSLIQIMQDSSYAYAVVASDGHGGTASSSITVTVADVPVLPPVNHAPVDLLLVGNAIDENAANASLIGQFTARDPDGDSLTYTLVDDAGGRFQIRGDKLVAGDGSKLDYETNPTHELTVRVTDSHGLSTDKTFTIRVMDRDEGRVIVGGRGADHLLGGAGNDTISGANGNDKLFGMDGNDILSGGLGKDVLRGGNGADIFVFATKLDRQNIDAMGDFSAADDAIQLSRSIFKAIGKKGALTKDAFIIGTKAKDAEDRIIYDKKGKLFYDSDGTGDHAAVQIATLGKNLKMSHLDFFGV